MPTKFTRTNYGTAAYTAIDPTVKGRATVTFSTASGVVLRIAGELDSAPAIGTTAYAAFASNSSAVFSFECDPSRTWILAGSGGGTLEAVIYY